MDEREDDTFSRFKGSFSAPSSGDSCPWERSQVSPTSLFSEAPEPLQALRNSSVDDGFNFFSYLCSLEELLFNGFDEFMQSDRLGDGREASEFVRFIPP